MPKGPGEYSHVCERLGDEMDADAVVLVIFKDKDQIFDVALREGVEASEISAALRKFADHVDAVSSVPEGVLH